MNYFNCQWLQIKLKEKTKLRYPKKDILKMKELLFLNNSNVMNYLLRRVN